MAGDMPGAIETYQALLRYGAGQADIPIQVSAQNKIARVMMFSGRLEEMEQYLLSAEKLAREYAETTGLAEMFTVKCIACNFTGDFASGVQYMAEAAQIGKELNVQTQIVYGLTHRAMMLTNMTRFDEGWGAAQEASEAIEATCNLLHKAELLGAIFVHHYLRQGDMAAAQQSAQEGVAIARRIGYPYAECMVTFMLGHLCYLRGEYEQAISWLEQSRQIGRAMGMPMLPVYGLAQLGSIYQQINGPDSEEAQQYYAQALALLDSPMGSIAGGHGFADVGFGELALGHADHAGELFQKGLTIPSTQGWLNRPELLIGLADVALAQDDLDEAARHIGEARQYVDDRAMKHFYPAVAFAEARLSLARGDHEQALAQLAQAEAQALAMGMRPIVWQTRAESANVLARLGRMAEAAAKRSDAQAMIAEIAGLFKDERLRAKFVESATMAFYLRTPDP